MNRTSPRILQTIVSTTFPEDGLLQGILFGEAPGPLGADQSAFPFWGDRAGEPLYRALKQGGFADFPDSVWHTWDGAHLKALGLRPVLRGVALGNALDRCPTEDGVHFRAPLDRELRDPINLERLSQDLARARELGATRLICLGKRAAWVMERLSLAREFQMTLLPHPSAQGLLQAAPNRGKGCRLADLQQQWADQLLEALPSPFAQQSAR